MGGFVAAGLDSDRSRLASIPVADGPIELPLLYGAGSSAGSVVPCSASDHRPHLPLKPRGRIRRRWPRIQSIELPPKPHGRICRAFICFGPPPLLWWYQTPAESQLHRACIVETTVAPARAFICFGLPPQLWWYQRPAESQLCCPDTIETVAAPALSSQEMVVVRCSALGHRHRPPPPLL